MITCEPDVLYWLQRYFVHKRWPDVQLYIYLRLSHLFPRWRHMDPILAAYQKLVDDRKDLDAKYVAEAGTAEALVAAQGADDAAKAALTSGVANFDTDKNSLIDLVKNSINSGPPVK